MGQIVSKFLVGFFAGLTAFTFVISSALAEESGTTAATSEEVAAKEEARPELPSKNESWYSLWGLGLSRPFYPEGTQSAVDGASASADVGRISYNFDFLGFYFPVGDSHKTAVGPVMNMTGDRISDGKNAVEINQFLYAMSVMHFLGANIGDGLFFRGDFGFARYNVQSDSRNFLDIGAKSANGFGFLLGGGYGLPLSQESRLLLTANFSQRNVDGTIVRNFTGNMGFLF